jgi:CHASE3 domain sensor protein
LDVNSLIRFVLCSVCADPRYTLASSFAPSKMSLNLFVVAVQFERFQLVYDDLQQASKGGKTQSDLLVSLLNLETGARGFLVTGETQYLEPYQLGTSDVWTHYSMLQDLIRKREMVCSFAKQ